VPGEQFDHSAVSKYYPLSAVGSQETWKVVRTEDLVVRSSLCPGFFAGDTHPALSLPLCTNGASSPNSNILRHSHSNMPHRPHHGDWAGLHPTGEGRTGTRRDYRDGRSPCS